MTPTTTVTTNTRRRRRPSVAGGYVHDARPASPRRGSTLGTLFDQADTTAASHRHFYSPFSGSARYSRPNFSIESGWVDGFPEPKTTLSPVIAREEVDDVEYAPARYEQQHEYEERNEYARDDDLYNDADEQDDLHYYEKKNDVKSKSPARVSNGAPSGFRRNTFGIPINFEHRQAFAPPTPPSPRRPLPNGHANFSPSRVVLSPIDTNERRNTNRNIPVASTSKPKPVPPRTKPPPPPLPPIQTQLPMRPEKAEEQPILDTTAEITLLQENFNLLRTVLEDLQIMCTWFFAQRPVEAYTDHIDTCGAIENSVELILESLTRRRKLGEEEWSVRSPEWHQKYTRRMYSLNRTLFRLLSIRPTIEDRVLRSHQITAVLKKLQEHQNKMADLATKFQASFDRLKLRHIHFLLTKAHEDAHQRSKARGLDEASFESQWYEDKAVRADLRREFYAAQRAQHRDHQ